MSAGHFTHCPDWPALAGSRERLAGEAGSGAEAVEREWRAALDHRRDCAPCQERSRSADPLTLFQEMPAIELEPGAIEVMQQRVAGARRMLSSTDQGASPRMQGASGRARRRTRARWPATVAAGLLVVAVGWGVLWPRFTALSSAMPQGLAAEVLEPAPADDSASAEEAKRMVFEHLVSLPPVEGQMEVTLRVEGGSYELVQLGSYGR